MLQEAKRIEGSDACALYCYLQKVGEHRFDRLVQPGIRKARCFGRAKTLLHVLMAARVAGLNMVATRARRMQSPNRILSLRFPFVSDVLATVQRLIRSLTSLKLAQIGVFG